MIKDIVVNLNVGAEANWASDYAISVAAAFNAHLTGSVFLYAPFVPTSRAGYVPPEVELIERHDQAAIDAARVFDERGQIIHQAWRRSDEYDFLTRKPASQLN